MGERERTGALSVTRELPRERERAGLSRAGLSVFGPAE
jgi:hypothetical protein